MSRFHYWQYLINIEGQPISDANISIYLAGTNTAANVYLDEFGENYASQTPQIITNNLGYFEFFIGDAAEQYGYEKGQKFKLEWEKPGVAFGKIDWIDIFPHTEEVDETDTNEIKDKLISNNLAYLWENHRTSTLQDDGFPIHGIEPINESDTDTFPNKLLSNELGKKWNDHVEETYVDNPHSLEPVNISDTDQTFNKLVSNKTLNDLNKRTQQIVMSFPSSDTWTLNHDLNNKYVSIMVYDTTDFLINPTNIKLVDENTAKVYFNNPISGTAVIIGTKQ